MSGYLEVSIVDEKSPQAGMSALIDVASVYGISAHPKLGLTDASSPGCPITVFFRASTELHVFGPSVIELLSMVEHIKKRAKTYDGLTIVLRENYSVESVRAPNGWDVQIRYIGDAP